jgi:hypothetical protein
MRAKETGMRESGDRTFETINTTVTGRNSLLSGFNKSAKIEMQNLQKCKNVNAEM